MFETDEEYLRKAEERFKKDGLEIENKNILLANHHKNLKLMYILSILASIVYSFFIVFVFGRG